MYISESKNHQYSFTHDWFVVPKLDENHELIKISKTIDWPALSAQLAQFYCPDNGRPAKPSRAKVGLLILKHLYHLSDDNLVDLNKRDPYAQYLCVLSFSEAVKLTHSTTLVKFRKKIGLSDIKLNEEEVLNSLKRTKFLKEFFSISLSLIIALYDQVLKLSQRLWKIIIPYREIFFEAKRLKKVLKNYNFIRIYEIKGDKEAEKLLYSAWNKHFFKASEIRISGIAQFENLGKDFWEYQKTRKVTAMMEF